MNHPDTSNKGKRFGNSRLQESLQNQSAKNEFRLSSNAPQFGDSLTVIQVQNVTQIAQLHLHSKITSVFNIIELKVLSKMDLAIRKIKVADDPCLAIYTNQRSLFQLGTLFFNKLKYFQTLKTLKYMGNFMTNLKMLDDRTRNQNSKREMLRANSRVERDYDDFQLIQRNNSHEENGQKTNKILQKKKQKRQKQNSLFKLQMDQLLSHHENYLRKKG